MISDIYNDLDLIKINIILFLAILGFFIFNWPKGLIFIGDGGAYLFGSIIGWMCILLTQKHPNIPFFYILCFICYPISEVIITFFRRILKTKNPMMPDDYHMHSMLYKLVNKKKMEKNFIHKFGIDSNSLTSIIIISFNLILGFIIYYGMPIILANEISHYIFLIEFLIFIIIFLLLKKYSPS